KLAGLDAQRLSECAGGTLGNQLLKSSFGLSKSHQVASTPTLVIDGRPYSGGRTSHHLSRALCAALKETGGYCGSLPEPTEVPVTILFDPKCEEAECDTSRFKLFVEHNFPGAVIREIDAGSEDGKKLVERSKAEVLP